MRCFDLTPNGFVPAELTDPFPLAAPEIMRVRVASEAAATSRASLHVDAATGALVLLAEAADDLGGVLVVLRPSHILTGLSPEARHIRVGATVHSCPLVGGVVERRDRRRGRCRRCQATLLGVLHPIVAAFDNDNSHPHTTTSHIEGRSCTSGIAIVESGGGVCVEVLDNKSSLSVQAWEVDGRTGLRRAPERSMPHTERLLRAASQIANH